MRRLYDVLVIGGGHAGCEAALAAARIGADTLLVTGNLSQIAAMPCNCSIGGPAKAHLVSEIDALGGAMGRCIDATYTHIRVLNTTKGPAVRALRAQADKSLYGPAMKRIMEEQTGLSVFQAEVTHIAPPVTDVEFVVSTAEGATWEARRVVLATGTFLNGMIHIGEKSFSAGRAGEPASIPLPQCLAGLGVRTLRMKTGTVPRVYRDSVDTSSLRAAASDTADLRFAWDRVSRPMARPLPCWRTATTPRCHAIVRADIERSSLVSCRICGAGPRYCPSIEAKLLRFPDRDSHGVFLELEGVGTTEIYVQGTSNSLPVDVQIPMVNAIPGLERAVVSRPGYAVEYDVVSREHRSATMEIPILPGFYVAGQVNGSSGYEEAAAQGLVAGANAALSVSGHSPLQVRRDNSYIGVLVDDLTHTRGPEPYRILTSRVEARLSLSQDTAHARLSDLAYSRALVDDARRASVHDAMGRANGSVRRGPLARTSRRIASSRRDAQVYGPSRRLEESRSPAVPAKQRWPGALPLTSLPVKQEVRDLMANSRIEFVSDLASVAGLTPGDIAAIALFVERWRGDVSRETRLDDGDGGAETGG
ncbi:MAG TPA: tRNA uridine-5-carboxymethylaminomethyl(34) synthesis enzyme MnmG [Armatimonadota bacterium]|nr:tRNA uridine-5-carboxymethylaminomethyl(34) synthesis enzyme MnmG [Armatimonadota bacterium]